MPKKTDEKNNKGVKKATKTSSTKKHEKAVKVPETKVEVKEVNVVKKEKKKGNSLLNNTPFVVACCVIILLVAVLVFVLCIKRVPVTSKGEEIVATIKGKKVTADELYLSLKDLGGKEQLLSIIDEYISEKEVTFTKEDEKYVQEIIDYYIESAKYYETDLATLLANYGLAGIETEKDFKEFLTKDYKKTLAIRKYIAEKADEKDLKEYYKKNYTDTLTVKHILIEIDGEEEDKEKADEKAYDKAVKLIQKLNNTDSKKLDKKFEELAEKNSDDTGTYSKGGLVENFQKADVKEPFYDAAYKLKDGEYTKEPVKTDYGYHIILKVSSTPVKPYKELVNDVKKAYAEEQLSNDSTLLTLKWEELRNEYKLSIKDDLIKKAYKDELDALKKSKTEK